MYPNLYGKTAEIDRPICCMHLQGFFIAKNALVLKAGPHWGAVVALLKLLAGAEGITRECGGGFLPLSRSVPPTIFVVGLVSKFGRIRVKIFGRIYAQTPAIENPNCD